MSIKDTVYGMFHPGYYADNVESGTLLEGRKWQCWDVTKFDYRINRAVKLDTNFALFSPLTTAAEMDQVMINDLVEYGPVRQPIKKWIGYALGFALSIIILVCIFPFLYVVAPNVIQQIPMYLLIPVEIICPIIAFFLTMNLPRLLKSQRLKFGEKIKNPNTMVIHTFVTKLTLLNLDKGVDMVALNEYWGDNAAENDQLAFYVHKALEYGIPANKLNKALETIMFECRTGQPFNKEMLDATILVVNTLIVDAEKKKQEQELLEYQKAEQQRQENVNRIAADILRDMGEFDD